MSVVLWDRAPRSISTVLWNPWWVIREGPTGNQELWAIAQRRRNGRFSPEWTFIGQFTWQGVRIR